MEEYTEKLKLVIELATDKGKEEQKNCHLMDEVELLKKTIKRQAELLAERDEVIAGKDEMIAQQGERIRELEYMVSSNGVATDSQSPWKVVVVNQYFALSTPKTVEYVRSLDDDHRIFAGHFLIHTMADGAPPILIEKVTEMTRLEGCKRQQDLNDAIEKAVERPTTVYQSGSTHNDKRSQLVFGEEKHIPLKRLRNE